MHLTFLSMKKIMVSGRCVTPWGVYVEQALANLGKPSSMEAICDEVGRLRREAGEPLSWGFEANVRRVLWHSPRCSFELVWMLKPAPATPPTGA